MEPKQTRYVTRSVLKRFNKELYQAVDDLPYPSNESHSQLHSKCVAILEEAIFHNNSLICKLEQLETDE